MCPGVNADHDTEKLNFLLELLLKKRLIVDGVVATDSAHVMVITDDTLLKLAPNSNILNLVFC